jgi:hypothetical protein
MRPEEEKLLAKIVKESGITFPARSAANNPIENSYWSNLIDGALNALEIVAIGSFDWKLVGIVKLLKSWLSDKRREKEELRMKTEYGYNHEQVGYPANGGNDSWNNTYY